MLSTALLLATAFGHVFGLPQIYTRDNELKTYLGDDKIRWSKDCSYLGFESDLPYSQLHCPARLQQPQVNRDSGVNSDQD
jgi:hypothetical protein